MTEDARKIQTQTTMTFVQSDGTVCTAVPNPSNPPHHALTPAPHLLWRFLILFSSYHLRFVILRSILNFFVLFHNVFGLGSFGFRTLYLFFLEPGGLHTGQPDPYNVLINGWSAKVAYLRTCGRKPLHAVSPALQKIASPFNRKLIVDRVAPQGCFKLLYSSTDLL